MEGLKLLEVKKDELWVNVGGGAVAKVNKAGRNYELRYGMDRFYRDLLNEDEMTLLLSHCLVTEQAPVEVESEKKTPKSTIKSI